MRAGPVIGIAGASYVVARPFGDLAVHGIPRRYVDHVVGAGGRAVVLPPGIGHDVLDLLDGLVLAGGGDIYPALYGRVGVRAREVDRARDEAEIALVREAREARVPMLGVCRGAQVFAVADGGTLVPDLGPDRPHVLATTSHPIKTFPGSACARLLGLRSQVSSLHHQAIDRTGSGWRTTGWADDGVVEAIEWDDSATPLVCPRRAVAPGARPHRHHAVRLARAGCPRTLRARPSGHARWSPGQPARVTSPSLGRDCRCRRAG